MSRQVLGALALGLLLAVSGCSGKSSQAGGSTGATSGAAATGGTTGSGTTSGATSGTGGTSGAPVTWYPQIEAIADQHCISCHQQGGIAPFTLGTPADWQAHQAEIVADVTSRKMPPWPPGAGCSDYQGNRALSDAQVQQIQAWAAGGALPGDVADSHPTTPPSASLSRVDTTLSMPAPYIPTISPDDYRCFIVDWPEQATKYVTGFTVHPGNPKIVHHVIAFLATPDEVPAYQALDAGSDGYTCFGDTGVGQNPNWIGAWAPGTLTADFPADTGIKIDPGSKIILQVHYNVLNGPGESDLTTVDMKLDDSVAKEAAILPWASPWWLQSGGMPIAAGDADAHQQFAYDPTPYMDQLTNNVIPANVPFTIYSAAAHMHLRGHTEHLGIQKHDGTSQCLLDIPDWDFHWQGGYLFQQPKVLSPGDLLGIECHWDNSAANQPWVNGVQQAPQNLEWGEGTEAEMCLGLFYVTQ